LDNLAIIDKLTHYISVERLRHTIGVRDTAVKLAERYDCSSEKVELASLLHDVARDMGLESMRNTIESHNMYLEDYDLIKNNPLLLHACAGRIIAKEDFGIKDDEILNSIEFHTTGRSSMDLMSKIIFVADYIEPTRSFNGVKEARRLAYKAIDKTVLYIYKSTIRRLLNNRCFIHKNTIDGYNELIRTC